MSLTFLLPWFLILSLLAISDARVAKRSVPPPKTLEIPVRLDENNIYSVMVNMVRDNMTCGGTRPSYRS